MKPSWSMPERFAQRAQVLLDERRREPIVAGRHRRVGGEDDLRRDARGSPSWQSMPSALHALTHQLERGERTVPFVQMNDAGRDAQRVKGAHAADAEQQLLPDAHAAVAAVESGGELAVFGPIALDVGVEQQQRAAADGQLPDARGDRACSRLDRDVTGAPPRQSRARVGSSRWSTSM